MKPRTTFEKRRKEMARKVKNDDKAARRKQREEEKANKPETAGDEDPDIAHIVWGPQPVNEDFL